MCDIVIMSHWNVSLSDTRDSHYIENNPGLAPLVSVQSSALYIIFMFDETTLS